MNLEAVEEPANTPLPLGLCGRSLPLATLQCSPFSECFITVLIGEEFLRMKATLCYAMRGVRVRLLRIWYHLGRAFVTASINARIFGMLSTVAA